MVKTLLVTLIVMHASAALAADYQSCLRNSQGIDPKMRDCQDTEIGAEDAALNKVYASLLARLKTKPDAADAVRDAERAWVRFRDANCNVVDAVYGDGSLDRMQHGDCIINMTESEWMN